MDALLLGPLFVTIQGSSVCGSPVSLPLTSGTPTPLLSGVCFWRYSSSSAAGKCVDLRLAVLGLLLLLTNVITS